MPEQNTVDAVRRVSDALFKAPHRLELAVLIAGLEEPELTVVQLHGLMVERHINLGEDRHLDRSSVSRNLKKFYEAGLLRKSTMPGAYVRVPIGFWNACEEILNTIEET